MTYFKPLLIAALLLCVVGMWGCNQQKTGAIASKIHELEIRYGKLEEDYRTLHTMSEQNKKRLTAVEVQRAALQTEKNDLAKQLDGIATERETLRKQLTMRTGERDTAQSQLVQFSRDLQALAGRVEAAANNHPNSNAPIIPASRRNE